jgi:hypothetical protein
MIDIKTGKGTKPDYSRTCLYMGSAGAISLRGLNRLRFEKACRVIYRYIHPNRIEIMGMSAQSVSNGLLRYPVATTTGTPWMIQFQQILRDNGFPPIAMCYTDGSYKQSRGSMWQYMNSVEVPPEVAAGMVYTYPNEDWRMRPILIIHINFPPDQMNF